jgi:hypothetical protein
MNGRIQGNNDLNAQSLQASLNSREAKEYGIKVWNRIEFNPDKIKKLKKSRKAIDLTARMCIKLNDIETIRVQFEALCRSDKDYGTSFKTALTVMKKVYHIFVNMVIYVVREFRLLLTSEQFSGCEDEKILNGNFADEPVYGGGDRIHVQQIKKEANKGSCWIRLLAHKLPWPSAPRHARQS